MWLPPPPPPPSPVGMAAPKMIDGRLRYSAAKSLSLSHTNTMGSIVNTKQKGSRQPAEVVGGTQDDVLLQVLKNKQNKKFRYSLITTLILNASSRKEQNQEKQTEIEM